MFTHFVTALLIGNSMAGLWFVASAACAGALDRSRAGSNPGSEPIGRHKHGSRGTTEPASAGAI